MVSKREEISYELLAVLRNIAKNGDMLPQCEELAGRLNVSKDVIRHTTAWLISNGDIEIEKRGISVRRIRVGDHWTGWNNGNRKYKANITIKDQPTRKQAKVRKCLWADCRKEFTPTYPGEWYCKTCRRSRRDADIMR